MNLPLILGIMVASVAVIAVAGSFFSAQKTAGLRARGLYPEEGRETDADVARLLAAGEKIMAIKCYRMIHKVGLKEAKEAVELLERK